MTPEQIAVAMPQIEAHVAMGLLAFPAKQVADTKVPAYAGWQTKRWDLGMLERELLTVPYYGLTLPRADPRRLILLDLDDGRAGLQPGQTPWQERWKQIGPMPKTKVTATPSGGAHAWFVWPDGAPLPKGTWHGFTVRSLHGAKHWAAGPGSVRPDGRPYQDVNPGQPIAEMPLALALSGGKPKPLTNGHAGETPERLTTRDEILSFAGRLRFAGNTATEIEATLLARLDDGRIYPSDPARPWTRDELIIIAADIGSKAPGSWTAPITLTGTSRPPAGDPDPDVRSEAEPAQTTEPPAHLVRQSRAAWYFAMMAGDRVRFDHGRGRWLIWSGHRWRPDEDGSVNRLWLDGLATRYRQALGADDRERVRLAADVQTAGATNSAIVAGLDIASTMRPIATTADAWDPDPWVLGCENGVVDLRTGRLRPGRPEEMISRSTGIAYDPAALCPRWERFLAEVFAGDEELVDWYGLLLGMSLVGTAQEEILALHHGLGNNGKSVAVRAQRHAIGEYAVVIPVETLVNAKRAAGEATPDLMALRGARIAFTSEPDQAAKLRGGTLKRLASVDRMTGRSLYGTTQTWEPTHTVHLSTNHLPAVDDATDGFWRRVALIPWPVHFRKPGEDGTAPPEDPDLAATLALEGPGILAWAVRGAVAHAAGRTLHPFPAAVRVRTDAYRADEDKLGTFVAEHVAYERDASVAVGILFGAYKDWCEAEDVKPFERLGQKLFARGFEERGHGVARVMDQSRNRVVFIGARLALSTDPGRSGHLTHLPEVSTRSSDSEKSGKYPQVPGMPGDSASPDSPDLLAMGLDVGSSAGPVDAPSDAATIACSDYLAHQSHHRRTGDGWTCDACEASV